MKHALWLMLILTACSTTPSTHGYQQMAPGSGAAVEPIYLPGAPGMAPIDAPHTTGMPGYGPNPRPPVSPHRRPLPPTEVPTLFSGDRPHAGPAPEPRLFDLNVPLPDDEHGKVAMNQCLAALQLAGQRLPEYLKLLNAATLEQRRCALAWTIGECLIDQIAKLEEEQGAHRAAIPPEAYSSRQELHEFWRRKEARDCRPLGKPRLPEPEHNARTQLALEMDRILNSTAP